MPRAWWAALALMAAGLIAVLYVLLAAASKPQPQGGYMALAVGAMTRLVVLEEPPSMPAQRLSDAAGGEVTLHGLGDGQVLLVNLWATWCAPCVTEMPTLGALARRFEGRGVAVVAVSVDGEAKEAEARAQLRRLTDGALEFYADPSRGVLFSARAAGMPVTIIYGRDGAERARLTGGADWASAEAIALVEAVLAEGR